MNINIFIFIQVFFPSFYFESSASKHYFLVKKIVRFKLDSTFKFKPILNVV